MDRIWTPRGDENFHFGLHAITTQKATEDASIGHMQMRPNIKLQTAIQTAKFCFNKRKQYL
jgi:hypothetical protein